MRSVGNTVSVRKPANGSCRRLTSITGRENAETACSTRRVHTNNRTTAKAATRSSSRWQPDRPRNFRRRRHTIRAHFFLLCGRLSLWNTTRLCIITRLRHGFRMSVRCCLVEVRTDCGPQNLGASRSLCAGIHGMRPAGERAHLLAVGNQYPHKEDLAFPNW